VNAINETRGTMDVRGACAALGLPRATWYRAQARLLSETPGSHDRIRSSVVSPRALSSAERSVVLEKLNSPRFVDLSVTQVYATMLDEDCYLCSPRTMYRILDAAGEVRERRNQLRHPNYKCPELLATRPNQVWSWDITKLKGPTKWKHYHLYVIIDIFSRYVVGWMIAPRESAALAKKLIEDTLEKQGITRDQLTIHADRGSSMTSKDVAFLLADLGVTKTHSRPHVSNDNPYSEAQFKTLKYRPEFPDRFGSIEDARAFCQKFFGWYNRVHYHSGIALLTPHVVHHGDVETVVARRNATLNAAQQRHPERFAQGKPAEQRRPTAAWINPPTASTLATVGAH
jgi:putative transposase